MLHIGASAIMMDSIFKVLFVTSLWCVLCNCTQPCMDQTLWYTSKDKFDNTSLEFNTCDTFNSECSHSSQVVCQSEWRLSSSDMEWRESTHDEHTYTLIPTALSAATDTESTKLVIEHRYQYACNNSNNQSPNTLCSSNLTYGQSTRELTIFLPEIHLKASSENGEVLEGETIYLNCSTNLPSSNSILIAFQHGQREEYCRPFRQPVNRHDGWIVYRTTNDDCILKIENITTDDAGDYTCVGYIPTTFTEIHSRGTISLRVTSSTSSSPESKVTDNNIWVHIIALWIVTLTLIVIAILAISTVIVCQIRKKLLLCGHFQSVRQKDVVVDSRSRVGGNTTTTIYEGTNKELKDDSRKHLVESVSYKKSRAASSATDEVFLQSQRSGKRLNSDSVKLTSDEHKESISTEPGTSRQKKGSEDHKNHANGK